MKRMGVKARRVKWRSFIYLFAKYQYVCIFMTSEHSALVCTNHTCSSQWGSEDLRN